MADINALKRRTEALTKPAANANDVTPGHVPAIRTGESALTSRPFSLTKMFGLMSKALDMSEAKIEYDLMTGFKKALQDTSCIPERGAGSSFYYPGSRPCLPYQAAYHKATNELLLSAGSNINRADPDEMDWIESRLSRSPKDPSYGDTGRFSKGYEPTHLKAAMSYLTDLTGGAMVAPPEMGEIIPLMRNMSAVDRAGARMVPLPPQGKWVAPRVASASTGYWIGENTAITQSNPTFGQAEMQAKKLGVLILVPNELFKYASPSADAILREDMAKTLALGYDFACLYGTSGAQPKGLLYYSGSDEVIDYAAATPAPLGLATDGNTVQPQDGYLMSAGVEDRNFDLAGFKWIMRPREWGKIASFRSSSGAATTADQLGLFVQDLTRALGAGAPAQWCGYPVVRSAQVRNTLTKGSGTGLTEVWGGVWNDGMLLGMYGAVEFATATQGDTMFAQDQTMIRGILHCDSVPRYAGAFTRYKEVLM